MPGFLLIIVFNSDTYIQLATPVKQQNIIYALVFVTTLIIPVFVSFLLLKNGWINSLHLETARERRFPYLITGTCYFFTFYFLKQQHISALIYLLFLGATLALLITLLINMRWKISAHMVGIGGVIGALMGISLRLGLDYRMLLLTLIFLSGVIGTARMLMKAHTPAQIYSGFFVGVFSQLMLFLIL